MHTHTHFISLKIIADLAADKYDGCGAGALLGWFSQRVRFAQSAVQ